MTPSAEKNSSARAWRALARLMPMVRPYAGHLAGCLAVLVAATAASALGPLLVRHAIDRDIAGRDLAGLQRTLLAFGLLQVLSLASAYALRVWMEWVGQATLATLKARLVDHVLRLPISFFDRHPAGQLLSRVQNDTQALRALFGSGSVTLIADLTLFAVMLTVMARTSLRLTAVLVLLLPVMAGMTIVFHRRTHPIFMRARQVTAELCASLAELLEALPLLAAFGRRPWALAAFEKPNAERYRRMLRGEQLFAIWFQGVNLLQDVALSLVLLAGGVWALQGMVSLGTLAMFLGYLRRFFAPLSSLSEQLGEIQRGLSAAERVGELLAEPMRIEEPAVPRAWPGQAPIRFEDVWFRYGPEEPWALAAVSFTIPAGEHWAVVGSTGSGKSTLASLLLRFHDPERGRILVGDTDLRELPSRALRQKVGLVLQDVDLFPTDLRTNVTMGRTAGDDRVSQALARVQADAVVARLPRGLSMDLSEHGRNLSLGERQLFSFARAVVGEPDVLVLDEATSALDPATEQRVAVGMEGLLKGRTALVVAHRLATVRACHRVLVLDRGRIVEQGSPAELRSSGGRFHQLAQLQEGEVSRVA